MEYRAGVETRSAGERVGRFELTRVRGRQTACPRGAFAGLGGPAGGSGVCGSEERGRGLSSMIGIRGGGGDGGQGVQGEGVERVEADGVDGHEGLADGVECGGDGWGCGEGEEVGGGEVEGACEGQGGDRWATGGVGEEGVEDACLSGGKGWRDGGHEGSVRRTGGMSRG